MSILVTFGSKMLKAFFITIKSYKRFKKMSEGIKFKFSLPHRVFLETTIKK